MTTYLSRLTDHPSFSRLAPFMPPGICPFLFYNLTPYIFTLSRGGWFGWVKRHRNLKKRAPVGRNDFTKKSINRKYVNEVLVRCPNSGKKVVAGVGPWDNGRTALRILHGNDGCPNGHQAGQTILTDDDGRTDVQQFYRLFPEVVSKSLGNRSMAEAVRLYDQRDNGKITVSQIIAPCRFHKRSNGPSDSLLFTNLLPDNFCPHVFAAIYPQVLALMYGANIEPVVVIEHPGGGGEVRLQLQKNQRTGMFAERTLNVIEKGLHWAGRPMDRLDYDITIIVQNSETPGCTLRPDKSCAVNINNPAFCCPAAFATLYPYLLLTATGAPLPWHDKGRICCPDCAGVTYRLD